jgi:hypothetical protein
VLARLLALLLGISPLQSAMAGFTAHAVQAGSGHQMGHEHEAGMTMDQNKVMKHDCRQCQDPTGCSGHTCSSGHCSSCAPALLSTLQHFVIVSGLGTFFRLMKHFHYATHPTHSAHPRPDFSADRSHYAIVPLTPPVDTLSAAPCLPICRGRKSDEQFKRPR